jgi:hypothetical protein
VSNKYKPHLQILPEDDANREFATGFLLESRVCERSINVLKPAGGWMKVVESIESCGLASTPERRLLLLIDFDDDVENRLQIVRSRIPENLRERVFILGTASEPEQLRKQLGKKLEDIGQQIAKECADGDGQFWIHPLVQHNQGELERLSREVKGFLIDA